MMKPVPHTMRAAARNRTRLLLVVNPDSFNVRLTNLFDENPLQRC